MFLSVVTAMLLNTTEQMLFSAPKKSGTASHVQKVYGAVVCSVLSILPFRNACYSPGHARHSLGRYWWVQALS